MAGIEPAISAWKAEVLPLNYIRIILNLHLLYAVTNHSSDRVIVKFFCTKYKLKKYRCVANRALVVFGISS